MAQDKIRFFCPGHNPVRFQDCFCDSNIGQERDQYFYYTVLAPWVEREWSIWRIGLAHRFERYTDLRYRKHVEMGLWKEETYVRDQRNEKFPGSDQGENSDQETSSCLVPFMNSTDLQYQIAVLELISRMETTMHLTFRKYVLIRCIRERAFSRGSREDELDGYQSAEAAVKRGSSL